jgi:hypothetical protein
MNLAFGLLFSAGDHNYGLGGNIEKGRIDVDLRPGRRGTKKYFLCFTAYTVPTRKSAGRGRLCKWLIFWWAV